MIDFNEQPKHMKPELIQNVLQWAKDKGITGPQGKGTLLGQLKKSQEELTETRDAAVLLDFLPSSNGLRSDVREELADGIGDTAVTLIILSEMMGTRIDLCLNFDVKPERQESILAQLKEAQRDMVELVFSVMNPLAGKYNDLHRIGNLIHHLNHICAMAELDLNDCLAGAYEVISRRSGTMIDGTFVKSKEVEL